ncbi:hypothetical protein ACFY36_37385 [Actinoplanes sp. NPDC000266]
MAARSELRELLAGTSPLDTAGLQPQTGAGRGQGRLAPGANPGGDDGDGSDGSGSGDDGDRAGRRTA